MADGYLTFDTKLNTAGFKSGLGQVTGMFTKLAALAGVAFSVGAVVAFGKAAVQAAGQAEAKFKGLEFLMKANGRSMSEATSFIKEFTADGLVPMTSAYESYKNMVSRGYSTEQIEKMLKVMKDAAVYNRQGQFSMGEAMEKATMGLRMENSLLTDSVGIQKNVAKMWQEHAQTLGTVASSLTMAQKRQAEFNGFMKEGGVFAGAAQGYLNSYAGKMGQLTSSFTNLKVAVGNAIIPFLNAMLPAINAAILWFTRLFNIIGRVVNLLFGTNVGMVDAEAAIAGSAEQTANATEQTAANTEAAGKAAKGALASFDKLNVLAQDTEKAGGGGGGGGGGGTGGGLPTTGETSGLSAELEVLAAKIATIKGMITDAFGTGDFTLLAQTLSAGIVSALTKAREAIQTFDFKQFGIDAAKSINTIFEGTDWAGIFGQSAGLLSDGIKGFLDTVIGFFTELDWSGIGSSISESFDAIVEETDWEGIFGKMGEALGKFVKGVLDTLITFFKETDWKKVGTSLYEAIVAFLVETDWPGILAKIIELLGQIIQGVGDFISGVFVGIGVDLKEGATKAWEKVEEAWSTVTTRIDEQMIQPIKKSFGGAWEDIKTGASNAWTKVEEAWGGAKSWFETTWTDIKTKVDEKWGEVSGSIKQAWEDVKSGDAWGNVENWFSNAWTNVKSTVDTKWGEIGSFVTGIWDGPDGIKAKWNEAATWFDTTIWTPIKTKAGEIWTAISTGASSIGVNIANSVVDAVNGVIGFINSMINGLEDAINGLINLVNTLPLINIPTIDLPNIKLLDPVTGGGGEIPNWWGLASGAVIPPNAPFMAVMGDQRRGTNLEAPESLIRQIVREEAGNAGGQNITITFGGTMGELVRQLKPHIERETMRTGGNMMAKAVRI